MCSVAVELRRKWIASAKDTKIKNCNDFLVKSHEAVIVKITKNRGD